ncbi:hypothetical protein G9C85_05275 [Halorubellus sp. JP-L1]|uniref:hypothetical protein n=1 Tax=Halorubellus sp. JP-L1 TaxID=2715753 RepID=UPI0014077175|nr:hypothetical protein [Halorubellus sp. JP-L1]NHN41048.1 hypothetical protein [Halorubellus sp. JP-L1]
MSDPGLNDGDRERIAEFLSKPAYERDVDDLVPADDPDEAEDASDGDSDDGGPARDLNAPDGRLSESGADGTGDE